MEELTKCTYCGVSLREEHYPYIATFKRGTLILDGSRTGYDEVDKGGGSSIFKICESCGTIWEHYLYTIPAHGEEWESTGSSWRVISRLNYSNFCQRWCEVAALDGVKVYITGKDGGIQVYFDLPRGLDYSRGVPPVFFELVRNQKPRRLNAQPFVRHESMKIWPH